VSCYAFIIGWLLPSLPPGYQGSLKIDLVVHYVKNFRTLTKNKGYLPLEQRPLHLSSFYNFFFNRIIALYHVSSYIHLRTLPLIKIKKCSTLMNFVENQLSPSLISLSPLIINHLSILQHTWVQSFDTRLRSWSTC